MTKHIELDRKFWPVEADQENDPESIRAMLAFGLGKQLSWEDLLGKDRVVILAEPGTGKTEEFRAITRRLRMASKPAFFAELSCSKNWRFDIASMLEQLKSSTNG